MGGYGRAGRDAGRDTIARIIGSATMPPSQADLVTVVTVLARAARWDPDDAARRARDMWVATRMDSARTPAAGVRVSQVDPRRLGVHAAISVPGVADEVPPEYVPRDADDGEFGLRAKVAAAAERGGFVLLVGGSSVGKSRTAFEAVTVLLPDWWLVHPAGPGEVAALASAPTARTVVWLDELQRYLDGEHGLTGGVVRALLNIPHPVVIIGTLWPDRYTDYTSVPVSGADDPHGREREVLDLATVIHIDPEFSPAEKDRARAAAAGDRRLAVALEAAGYGLTQTLAAAPQLVARWEEAQACPYAWAVLTAALDAARLGARATLSADFLRAAAPGYCTTGSRPRRRRTGSSRPWPTPPESCTAPPLPSARSGLAWARSLVIRLRTTCSSTPAGNADTPGCPPALGTPSSVTSAIPPTPTGSLTAPKIGCCTATLSRCSGTPPRPATSIAGYRLAELLEKRGALGEAEQILRGRADAGDEDAGAQLAALLARRGRLDEAEQILRGRVDAGDKQAGAQLTALLADRGDLDEVRALVDVGRARIPSRLLRFFTDRDDLDEVRAAPTRAACSPPGSWPGCWQDAATWMSCAPGPTSAISVPQTILSACWPSAGT